MLAVSTKRGRGRFAADHNAGRAVMNRYQNKSPDPRGLLGLHELRIRDRAGQVRVIYYIKRGDAVYLMHGFRKKTQTIPKRELDIIYKRLKEI